MRINQDETTKSNGYDTTTLNLSIRRPVYQQKDLNKETQYETPHKHFKQKCKDGIRSIRPKSCLYSVIPLLKWLPGYSWKKNFLSDIISGITVAVMHIPQGMAYGLLGGVPPVVGIYMAFFPVLVYFVFGTSRHVSIGTFAVVCLMTGKVVNEHSNVVILQNGTEVMTMALTAADPVYTNVRVATTVTFMVAVFQLAMYGLRLGIVCTLLSETMVSGFTCASAFHVVSSQLKDLFGLDTKKRRGNFGFIYTVYDAARALPNANAYSCAMTAVFCFLLVCNNEVVKPMLAKKTRVPFPIELVCVVVGTLLSYFFRLEQQYGMSTVGRIPTGLPYPSLPAFDIIPSVALDSFIICMVSYTITMSMALIFARKLMYHVDANQELLALGLSNTVGSFFSCMPVTASLSRSMIQQGVGGVTQLASIVSCLILLVILLWIGPLFESLPRAVLASIIVVALKNMLMQFTQIVRYWKLSKWDATVWTVTFCTTLFVQISYGLAAGVIISLLSIFVQGYKPYTCLLGVVPNTDLYLDVKRFKGARELEDIKIYHYSGGLSFASRDNFKKHLLQKVGFDPVSVMRNRQKMAETPNHSVSDSAAEEVALACKFVILDLSCLSFIDPSGVALLRQITTDFGKLDIEVYITRCSGPVFEMLVKCDKEQKIDSKFMIFPTIHDAVLYAHTIDIPRKSM